jgi:hypothetical protein
MLFADLPIQRSGKSLAKSFNGGAPVARDMRKTFNGSGKLVSVPRASHASVVRDAGDAFIGPIDLRTVTRLVAGCAENSDYLTRKTGRAIGMLEGWREIAGTAEQHRVGLLQIAVQTWDGK